MEVLKGAEEKRKCASIKMGGEVSALRSVQVLLGKLAKGSEKEERRSKRRKML